MRDPRTDNALPPRRHEREKWSEVRPGQPALWLGTMPADDALTAGHRVAPWFELCRLREAGRHATERERGVSATGLADQTPVAVRFAPGGHQSVVRRTPVGNLHVNRGTTGAMVGRQPFGANRPSGTGTKAGGPDYLHHFVESIVVTENTVRHGLAP